MQHLSLSKAERLYRKDEAFAERRVHQPDFKDLRDPGVNTN